MSIAIYPGTFDPVTNGHCDIVQRGAKLFHRLIVAVAASARKQPYFSFDDRLSLCRDAFSHIPNVTVEGYDGLLVRYLEEKQADVVLRGLRSSADIDYEFQLAEMNRCLSSQCETLFIKASDRTSAISSTLVREVAAMGGDIALFVPHCVVKHLKT
jgi:pantetheine-phosphate adenylyltransferase